MTNFSQQVADVVRGMLAERDINQEDVAKELSRAQSYVSVRFRGKKAWNMLELDGIASLLGITPLELLREITARAGRDTRSLSTPTGRAAQDDADYRRLK